jgi:hypothetical protein
MIALSTTSITAMEIVSAASATGIAAPSASPLRSNGTIVSEYPKKNASTTASAIVCQLPHPSAVPMIIPSTSPIAQPVRQCAVAERATRFSDRVPAP